MEEDGEEGRNTSKVETDFHFKNYENRKAR